MSKEPGGKNPAEGNSKTKKTTHAVPALEPLVAQFIEQPTPSEERDPCKPPAQRPDNEAERSVHVDAQKPAKEESHKKNKRPPQDGKAPASADTKSQDSPFALPYYHGLLLPIDVQNLLRTPGDFLLCITSIEKRHAKSRLWVKSTDDNVNGIDIHNDKGQYYVEGQGRRFVTVENLMDVYYRREKTITIGGNKTPLKNPVPRQKWELLHEQVECKRSIGQGAFGEVFEGRLRLDDKKPISVAVKTLKRGTLTPQKMDETMSEARVLHKLEHDNIVRFYGVAADREPIFVVMELVTDGALDEYLMAHRHDLEMRARLKMLYHAALGLEHVHSKHIIHRDIAARNFLYGGDVLKLCDFGLAREADKYNIGNERAPAQWLAPEVFKDQIFTPKADVWAYGVLVWEVFNHGTKPLAGWTLETIKKKMTLEKFRMNLPEWTPPAVKLMVASTWDEDPEKRPTMSDIATKMQEVSTGWGSKRVPKTSAKNKSKRSQKERSSKAVKSKRTSRERDVPSASSKKNTKKRLSSQRHD